ncbi:hypothetical protein MP638_000371 [Amoeboaphelidium occidentale]|nr:hypothetical protein MP638_000371 [Amoeboaphelidium occidentale]
MYQYNSVYSKELPSPPKPNPGVNLDQELKLYSNSSERELYDNLADLYAIIVSLEHLEKAYIRDCVPATAYSSACTKLIAQYKTAVNLSTEPFDLLAFCKKYFMSCPAAVNRLKIGVPATIEHASEASTTSAKYVAETVQLFITLMDSLKLNLKAVDQIHPLLSDLIQSLNRVVSGDFEGKTKIRNWLVTLNKMKASEEIDDEQARQLMFDLETAHNEFYRSLSDK